MMTASIEQEATLWMLNDIPARMVYAGQTWRVTDTPTQLCDSIWTAPLEQPSHLNGWRFQASDGNGRSLVFDLYGGTSEWHVHRIYE